MEKVKTLLEEYKEMLIEKMYNIIVQLEYEPMSMTGIHLLKEYASEYIFANREHMTLLELEVKGDV